MESDQLMQMNEAQQVSPFAVIIFLGIILILIAALWKTFTKTGEPGWASIIPIYNAVVLLRISGKPLWWLILMIIPVANFIVAILMSLGLAERFGKSSGFGIGLALLPFIFYPILGFGSATYIGPKAV